MFTHVEILALAKLSDIEKTVKVLRGLASKVEDIEELEIGTHELAAERAAHISIVARFADRDGYEAFQQHPEYAKTRQYLERVDAVSVHVAYPDKPSR